MSDKKLPPAPASDETPVLAPATYKLIGLEPNQKRILIPVMSLDIFVADLEKRPDVLEAAHLLGWPHVEKASN